MALRPGQLSACPLRPDRPEQKAQPAVNKATQPPLAAQSRRTADPLPRQRPSGALFLRRFLVFRVFREERLSEKEKAGRGALPDVVFVRFVVVCASL